MDYAVREIAPDVWRVDVGGTTRIVRFRRDLKTFAPWDICTAEGQRLWESPTLESAFRWIQARTGHPTEALLVEGLLEQTASHKALDSSAGAAPTEEAAQPDAGQCVTNARSIT
jgi:hypothetical protein